MGLHMDFNWDLRTSTKWRKWLGSGMHSWKKNEEKFFICWKLQRVGLVNHPPLELAKPFRWKCRWFLACVSLFYLGEYCLITNLTPIHFTPYLQNYLHKPLNQPFSAMSHTYTAIIGLFYYSSDSFRLTSFDFFFGL